MHAMKLCCTKKCIRVLGESKRVSKAFCRLKLCTYLPLVNYGMVQSGMVWYGQSSTLLLNRHV